MGNIVPGAVVDPGVHWDYQAGVATMWVLRWHYTVGFDSTAIGKAGFFGFRIARDGTLYQYSPDDAVDWDACEWNPWGKGIEVESIDGSITPEQIATLGYLTTFLLTNHGIPPTFEPGDNGRMPVGAWSWFRGVANHRALEANACDWHYDGFGTDIWVAAMYPAPAPAPTSEEDTDDMSATRIFGWQGSAVIAAIDGLGNLRVGNWHFPEGTDGWGNVQVITGPDGPVTGDATPAVQALGLGVQTDGRTYINLTCTAKDGRGMHVFFSGGWQVRYIDGAPAPAPPLPADTLDVDLLAEAANEHVQAIPKGTAATRRVIGDDVEAWLRRSLA